MAKYYKTLLTNTKKYVEDFQAEEVNCNRNWTELAMSYQQ